ncbi:MAG TPA: vWA domain-containing protein [Gaiellaceae bacterium]|nr:vWA domain-containing protein [Gaiellaceae bacterium]
MGLKTFVAGLLTVGLGCCIAFAGSRESSASAATQQPTSQLDVEIAVDGTASMASAIAQAKQAGVGITDGLISLLPDTRFSVVVFRDRGNPAGEYELLQPFTEDTSAVRTALGRIKTAFNPSPDNGPAESYNLAFERSYSDAQMGWRPSARKIVLVLGDAEPNGAGREGLPACQDRSNDPEGLSTRQQLANMRSAGRTLIMVRALSNEVSVSLRCYQSLAAGAFVGGAARDAGSDLVSTIVELVQGAYAPLTLKPDLGTALRTGRMGYTVKLQNPNLLDLTMKSVTLDLPRGFRYVPNTTSGMTTAEPKVSGRTLAWSLAKLLPTHKQLRLHVTVHAARRMGTYRSSAVASVETAAGNQLIPRTSAALLRVKRRITAVAFRFQARNAAGLTVEGRASARFLPRTRSVFSPVSAHGSLTLVKGNGIRLVLRVRRLRLTRLVGPTRARVTLRVASTHGLPGCRVGSAATLLLFNSNDVRQDDSSDAYLRLALPRSCGGPIRRAATISVSDS